MKNIITFLALLLLISACNRMSEEERMLKTAKKILYVIENEQVGDFKRFIGPPLDVLAKDDERVLGDFSDLKLQLNKRNKKEEMKITITDFYNEMGQRIIDIPVKHSETETADSIYHIRLLFGPPNVYPLSKITGYQLTRGDKIPKDFQKIEGPARSPK